LKPEVASLNMGSMNFGLYEMLGRHKDWKHDWEKPYLAAATSAYSRTRSATSPISWNPAAATTRASRSSATTIGHLYTGGAFLDRKLVSRRS